MRSQARLTMGLPVYNGENFLDETLCGMRNQMFGDFELIVSDNASTDATEEICRRHACEDRRIRYDRLDSNLGAVANFNRAFALGTAPYFKWIAHDDAYDPRYLAALIPVLDAHPSVVLAHTATVFIDEHGREFPTDPAGGGYIGPFIDRYRRPDPIGLGDSFRPAERFRQVLAQALWGTHMFGVIRREALARTRLLANFVSSDRAMLAELALLGRFETLDKPYFAKRFHAEVSWSLDQKQLKSKLSTSDVAYSRRGRQVRAFLTAPWSKPIGIGTKLACTATVVSHSLKTLGEIVARKDAHNEEVVRSWQSSSRGNA